MAPTGWQPSARSARQRFGAAGARYPTVTDPQITPSHNIPHGPVLTVRLAGGGQEVEDFHRCVLVREVAAVVVR
jgi:hypothetical protein